MTYKKLVAGTLIGLATIIAEIKFVSSIPTKEITTHAQSGNPPREITIRHKFYDFDRNGHYDFMRSSATSDGTYTSRRSFAYDEDAQRIYEEVTENSK